MKLPIKYFLFGLLSFISWNYLGILFIPAFALFYSITIQSLHEKWYVFLVRVFFLGFVFNVSVTFWLMGITWWESGLAYFGNSLTMLVPFFLTYILTRKNQHYFRAVFLTLWVLYEFLHSQWDFAWPWLTIGHVMGNMHYLVQWYSFTGVYFGTVWIILLGSFLIEIDYKKSLQRKNFFRFCILLVLPSVVSLYLYSSNSQKDTKKINVTCYTPEKSNTTNYQKTKKLYYDLKNYDTNPFIICPEVFLEPVNMYSGFQQKHFFYIDKFLNDEPETTLIFGTQLKWNRKLFNSIFVKNKDESLYRIKQKFVPIREFIPKALQRMFDVRSYYSENKYDFTDKIKNKKGFLPLVCYESTFSMFTAAHSKNSDFIILATSEEFMNSSYFGKRQYLNIVRLRAIENGRYVLKCSNQGISCVINQKGCITTRITKPIQNATVLKIKKNTFYQELIAYL